MRLFDVIKAHKNVPVDDPLAAFLASSMGGWAVDTITGIPPIIFDANGKPLTDYMIYGNTVQNGMPTPEAPVDVVGCGVRTGNVFDESNFALVQVTSTAYRYGTSLGVLSQGKYTFNATKSAGAQSIYLTAKLNGEYSQTTISSVPFSFTADGDSEYIIRTANSTGTTWEAEEYSDMMLNLGSTALPYEPYGYKLPLTVNGTGYPIYLGQVPTTRRIKKLVLTGEEAITKATGNPVFTMQLIGRNAPYNENVITTVSTHYQAQSNVSGTGNVGDMRVCIRRGYGTMYICDTRYDNEAGFKTYLAQQYAAGTPVTIWYVLAEPETGIVNEPLHRIGDYADTISMAQASVTIPTVSGANVLDMTSPVKPSEVYIKGNIKPTGYGKLTDKNGVYILDKNGVQLTVHGQ